MKPYKITEVKEMGEYKKRIRLIENEETLLDITFSYKDEIESIKKADQFIIDNKLDYATKILKK